MPCRISEEVHFVLDFLREMKTQGSTLVAGANSTVIVYIFGCFYFFVCLFFFFGICSSP